MPTENDSPSDNVRLPLRLKEAFQALRKGRHLCRADGTVWFDLRENAADYRIIFSALGYSLDEHPRGFYYFSEGQQARPDVLSRLVYFFTCLFSDLDQGRFELGEARWVDSLTDHDFDTKSLTQSMFIANDRQRIFDQLKVTRENFDKTVIAPLYRYGLSSKPIGGSLRFREGVHRFVEIFLTCGNEINTVQPDIEFSKGNLTVDIPAAGCAAATNSSSGDNDSDDDNSNDDEGDNANQESQ